MRTHTRVKTRLPIIAVAGSPKLGETNSRSTSIILCVAATAVSNAPADSKSVAYRCFVGTSTPVELEGKGDRQERHDLCLDVERTNCEIVSTSSKNSFASVKTSG
jgi:hypothetical protein